jgi:chromosome segregation ATPase
MTNEQLPQELKAKIKFGIKPSDLKKKTMPQNNDLEKYLQELEESHARLLLEKETWSKSQKEATTKLKKQDQQLAKNEQELKRLEEVIHKQAEQIQQLKARIKQLAQDKQELKKSSSSEDKETTNKVTQTPEAGASELAEQLLAKRLENLQDFTDYREQLKVQEQAISQLQQQLTVTRQRLIRWLNYPDAGPHLVLILSLLLIITGSLLLMKQK